MTVGKRAADNKDYFGKNFMVKQSSIPTWHASNVDNNAFRKDLLLFKDKYKSFKVKIDSSEMSFTEKFCYSCLTTGGQRVNRDNQSIQ